MGAEILKIKLLKIIGVVMRRIVSFSLTMFLALFLFSCGKSSKGESMVDSVKKRGVLKVGMSTFVPWAMNDKAGKLIGFEIDVAKELANDMGVKVEFVPTKWSGIIPALLTGKFDIIIGGMGITPEREKKVSFTEPYDYSGMSIVAGKKTVPGLSKLQDFNKPKVTIAARLGTTAAKAAKQYLPKAKIKLFDDESQAIQELLNGRADAVVASAPLPAFQSIKHGDKLYLPLKENFTKEPIGFALRKGDNASLKFLNGWIKKQWDSGFLKTKKNYWFRTRKWAGQIE